MKDQADEVPNSNRLLITIEEAARRLAIGRSHIYDQMQRGEFRSVKIGRSRRILECDLDAFVEQLLNAPLEARRPPQAATSKSPVKALPRRSGRR